MNPNQAVWEKGDFARIAESMRDSGEALVEQLGITEGLKILDLGCGDGTTALPAARLGADVLGVDIARNLVKAGNRRAIRLMKSNSTPGGTSSRISINRFVMRGISRSIPSAEKAPASALRSLV